MSMPVYEPLPEGVTKIKDFPLPTKEESEKRIGLFRKVADEKQFQKVKWINRKGEQQSMDLDLFTANTVLAIYNALNDEQKLRFTAAEPLTMVNMAWKLSNK
jgi:hypothetical protein